MELLLKKKDKGRTVKEMLQILWLVLGKLDNVFTRYFEKISAKDC
jgi:hypothetical protein